MHSSKLPLQQANGSHPNCTKFLDLRSGEDAAESILFALLSRRTDRTDSGERWAICTKIVSKRCISERMERSMPLG